MKTTNLNADNAANQPSNLSGLISGSQSCPNKVVNLIVTELAVIEVTPGGLVLREIAADTTVEAVKKATGAPLTVASPLGVFE